MKQYAYLRRFFLATLFTAGMAVAGTTSAAGLGDALKSGGSDSSSSNGLSKALGGGSSSKGGLSALGLPNLSSDMAGNAAGVLQYCIEHKYVDAMDAENVKSKLMDKAGIGSEEKDEDYEQGLTGMLTGSDGQSFDLERLKGDLKDKACDYVLEHGADMI
ncbi:MAG TPA: DUF2501 domain-containing protein [Paenalcaligenes sp.]|nr:DUF2501 domain-containing protein [Paenalcaligenes sp.]